MIIGLIHFRVGETDGVSLEMEKWKGILEGLGHKVWYIAGSGNIEDLLYVKELHYQNPTNELLVDHIYKRINDNYTEAEIKEIYLDYTKEIELGLEKVIIENQIEMIMPNNVLSLGWNIAAGKAITNIINKTNIKVIAHHHDFYWERELYSQPKYKWVKEILEECFPPTNDNVRHVVINNIAQRAMKERKNLSAIIVPNVFDFEENWMVIDDYNSNIKEKLGFKETDIIVLQGTRIVARKGIELTIRAIHKMNELLPRYLGNRLYNGNKITTETRIKLVCVGLNEDETYYQKLRKLAKKIDVDFIDVSHRIDFERRSVNGKKHFSLWDAYQLADIVSYPSLLEGFGNQLLEAIYANKPIIIYEYPVYESYLKEFGLEAISFGGHHKLDEEKLAIVLESITKDVATKTLDILTSASSYKKMAQTNYNICLKEFSYKKLNQLLRDLVGHQE